MTTSKRGGHGQVWFRDRFLKRFRVLLEDRRELFPWEELVSSLSHPLSIKRSGLWVIKCSLKFTGIAKDLGGQSGSWKVRAKETQGKAMNTAKGTLRKCVGSVFMFSQINSYYRHPSQKRHQAGGRRNDLIIAISVLVQEE